jgi:acyl-coenzyme A synthetase/AMP-(fatty) acid ligase
MHYIKSKTSIAIVYIDDNGDLKTETDTSEISMKSRNQCNGSLAYMMFSSGTTGKPKSV